MPQDARRYSRLKTILRKQGVPELCTALNFNWLPERVSIGSARALPTTVTCGQYIAYALNGGQALKQTPTNAALFLPIRAVFCAFRRKPIEGFVVPR